MGYNLLWSEIKYLQKWSDLSVCACERILVALLIKLPNLRTQNRKAILKSRHLARKDMKDF